MNEVLIYGDIGWENTAKDIQAQLNGFDNEPVNVRISSPGGDVYEGIAILNVLRAYAGEITVIIDSQAASAAAFIAVGTGGRVICRPNAELMIHRAWSYFDGNSDDVLKSHSDLERQDLKQANIFAEKAGGTVDEWLALMSAETWYTADEALAAGLVDEIVDAKASTGSAPAASIKNKRVMAQFKYSNRAAAPPPPLARRSESANHNQKKGDTVSILNQLAQELGKEPEDVEKALTGFLNEEITVTATVDISYPEISTVAPTDKITIHPEGEVPAGVVFAAGEAPEGWTVEVDESTGVVTVTAPSGVEPGDKIDIPVTVSGADNDNPTELNVAVEVKAAASEDETDTSDSPTSDDVVKVPRAMYDMLASAYEANHEQVEANAAKAREEAVDKWIAEGRFSAALRSKAIEAMNADESAAHKVWGALPKGKINRAEKGYTISKMPDTVSESSTKEDRLAEWLAKAEQRASAQK